MSQPERERSESTSETTPKKVFADLSFAFYKPDLCSSSQRLDMHEIKQSIKKHGGALHSSYLPMDTNVLIYLPCANEDDTIRMHEEIKASPQDTVLRSHAEFKLYLNSKLFKQGKAVRAIHPNKKIEHYQSIAAAARHIGVSPATVSKLASNNGKTKKGVSFQTYVPDRFNQQFHTSPTLDQTLNQVDAPDDKKVKSSPDGLVRTKTGRVTAGTRKSPTSKIRVVNLNGKTYPVHRLVFMAQKNKVPKGKIVHQPAILDDEGCYVNNIRCLKDEDDLD